MPVFSGLYHFPAVSHYVGSTTDGFYRSYWRSAVPTWCVCIATAIGFLRIAAIVLTAQTVATHCLLEELLDTLGAEQFESHILPLLGPGSDNWVKLKFLQALGTWYNEYGSKAGEATWLYAASLGILLLLVLVIFFIDIRSYRQSLGGSDTAIDRASLSSLPPFCRILRVSTSSAIFIAGLAVTAIGGHVARHLGVEMNRRAWEFDHSSTSPRMDYIVLSSNRNL